MDCSVVNSIDRDNRSGTFNNQGLRDGRRGKEYARWGVVRLVRAARDEILHEDRHREVEDELAERVAAERRTAAATVHRAGDTADDVVAGIHLTINGIAAGLRNSG